MRDCQPIDLYVLTNTNGVSAKILTYGATLVELQVPDRFALIVWVPCSMHVKETGWTCARNVNDIDDWKI
jgi:galactose mutarotase-like enzyme